MKCEICKNYEGDRYIAYPSVAHHTEDIVILSVCDGCIKSWFKAIPKELREEFRHWTLRCCNFELKMEQQSNGRWKTVGYGPEEEDLAI